MCRFIVDVYIYILTIPIGMVREYTLVYVCGCVYINNINTTQNYGNENHYYII